MLVPQLWYRAFRTRDLFHIPLRQNAKSPVNDRLFFVLVLQSLYLRDSSIPAELTLKGGQQNGRAAQSAIACDSQFG
jgi:hypothetical protein